MAKQHETAKQQELFGARQESQTTHRAKSAKQPRNRRGPITLRLTHNCPEAAYPEGHQPEAQYEIDRAQFSRLLAYRNQTGTPLRLIVRRALDEFLERHRVGRLTDRIQ
jgi:hypothetical protein